MDGKNHSSRPLEMEDAEREEEEQEDDEEESDEGEEDDEKEKDYRVHELRQDSGELGLEYSIGTELRASQSETLADQSPLRLPERDLHSDIIDSSHLLSEVPVEYNLQPLESAESKADAQMRNQLQSPDCLTSVPHTLSSTSSPHLPEEKLSPVEMDNNKNNILKRVFPVASPKASSSDGYNWRKYGQKQVKSPQGSRSYYKCTYSDCSAKKIECCDHSSNVIDIIYKIQHNHEPPRKTSGSREGRVAISVVPVVSSKSSSNPVSELDDSETPTCSKEIVHKSLSVPETKQQNLGSSGEDIEVNVKEEHVDEPDPKRRLKESSFTQSNSLRKPEKKQKFIFHAATDVGISGDGYRWRKYGQKMVKGNPHPRNYYRCTSAGCPARKHIETAVDNKDAVVITYKGIHDHDMPVPKKRHGHSSGPPVAATVPASLNTSSQLKKTEMHPRQISATQWSVGKEGELKAEKLDLSGKTVMESARTLLSIGFEIKPC